MKNGTVADRKWQWNNMRKKTHTLGFALALAWPALTIGQVSAAAPARVVPSPYAYKVDFSTFLGRGSGGAMIRGLTVDAQGNIYVCGPTASREFPTTPGAYMTTFCRQHRGA